MFNIFTFLQDYLQMQKNTIVTSKNPLVSVIIPIFNSDKYLEECLDSVLNQTYKNVEIICVNDGSTDESLSILNKYAKKHQHITVIDQSNSGVVISRNNGIKASNGVYILPLDSDDKILPRCIEILVNLIQTSDCAVAAPSVSFFGTQSGKFILPEPTTKNMAKQNCIVNCGLFKKESWEKYGGYDERFANGIEDYDFWWNFLQDGKQICRSEEILFYYRIRGDEPSRTQLTAHHHSGLIYLMSQKHPLMAKLGREHFVRRTVRASWERWSGRLARFKQYLKMSIRGNRILIWRRYKNYVLNQQLQKGDFVPIAETPYSGEKSKKIVAYYLPQYYQIPQNDEWFGRGFTEWSNAAKAVPQFVDHWQPHLPIDVGFYNLETTHAMHRQVELAKMYGIHGFCFYYYWFSGGDKIMEKPINNWLNDKSLDLPFMFFWANEDWTNTWGEQADMGTKVYSAKMKPEDVKKFVDDIIPFLKDSRYITIDGRPHITIYQAKKDPFLPEFITRIGKAIEKHGIKKPYISLVFPDENPDQFDPREYGGDAAVEFGVHMKARPDHTQQPLPMKQVVNPLAKIKAYDMHEFVSSKKYLFESSYPIFKGAMTTYDNTARKVYSNAYIFALSPELYRRWLSDLVATSTEDYIFISAWNEWAEGMHLEPDHRYGYAYLQATRDALGNAKATHMSNNRQ